MREDEKLLIKVFGVDTKPLTEKVITGLTEIEPDNILICDLQNAIRQLLTDNKKLTDRLAEQDEEIERKNKALVYAVRFLDPENCDRAFVKQALGKEGE